MYGIARVNNNGIDKMLPVAIVIGTLGWAVSPHWGWSSGFYGESGSQNPFYACHSFSLSDDDYFGTMDRYNHSSDATTYRYNSCDMIGAYDDGSHIMIVPIILMTLGYVVAAIGRLTCCRAGMPWVTPTQPSLGSTTPKKKPTTASVLFVGVLWCEFLYLQNCAFGGLHYIYPHVGFFFGLMSFFALIKLGYPDAETQPPTSNHGATAGQLELGIVTATAVINPVQQPQGVAIATVVSAAAPPEGGMSTAAQKLMELKQLHDAGAIDDEEYAQLKAKQVSTL
jgi:hypothetical protein